MDLVVRTSRFPEIGETVLGENFATFPGGKGANQAAAAGKLGGKPRFVAKVGADTFGRELLHSLATCGVDTGSVIVDPTLVTGIASITVDLEGRNSIVVAPGANAHLFADEVEGEIDEIGPEILLAQLEVPLEAIEAAAAKLPNDKLFILNPAPARSLPESLLRRVDYLTPNETETEFLTGIRPVTDEDCLAAADKLFTKGVRNVVITLGDQGSFLATPQFGQRFPTLEVRPVDTTAAGDAFNGALAFFLSEGRDIDNAILLANVVGALSTLKPGAQASMPTMRAVREVASELL